MPACCLYQYGPRPSRRRFTSKWTPRSHPAPRVAVDHHYATYPGGLSQCFRQVWTERRKYFFHHHPSPSSSRFPSQHEKKYQGRPSLLNIFVAGVELGVVIWLYEILNISWASALVSLTAPTYPLSRSQPRPFGRYYTPSIFPTPPFHLIPPSSQALLPPRVCGPGAGKPQINCAGRLPV
ncbi:hypothetical protein CPC08DRAFT_105252 [Agrocybe pediades]|nr:hypothetical protein CPC08DRAFT_105252 [Agrocybe pediades]